MTPEENNEVELTEKIDYPASRDLRKNNPELFGEEAKDDATDEEEEAGTDKDEGKGKGAEDDDAPTPEELEAIAAGEDDDRPRDEKGRWVPRARVDEITAERNQLREKLAERERLDTEAAAAAAKAKETPPRDLEAEREELETKFASGELDQEEYDAKNKALKKAEKEDVVARATATALAEFERREAEKKKASDADTFGKASAAFLAKPENAIYKDSAIMKAALQVAMNEVDAETKMTLGYDELLEKARERVESTLGGKPAAGDKPGETPKEKTQRERAAAGATAAAEASALPDRPAGGKGTRTTTATTKDAEHISREEWKKLPQAEKDRLLGRTAA